LPLTPVQILWVNLVTAVTLALALAFEPPEADIMLRPPRPTDSRLLPPMFLWRIAMLSILMCGGVLWLFHHLRSGGVALDQARGVAVSAVVSFEAWYLFNCRSILGPALGWGGTRRSNRWVFLTVALVALLQITYITLPLSQDLFSVMAISLEQWGLALGLGAILFAVVEIEKWTMRWWRSRER